MASLAEKFSAMQAVAPKDVLILRIELTPEIRAIYESQAKRRNLTLEQLFSERLTKCVNYTAEKPLYFNDDQRERLERELETNFSDPEKVIGPLKRAQTVFLQTEEGQISVTLSAKLFGRLRSRCFIPDFKKFLRERIVEGLERYVGMR